MLVVLSSGHTVCHAWVTITVVLNDSRISDCPSRSELIVLSEEARIDGFMGKLTQAGVVRSEQNRSVFVVLKVITS